MKIENSIDSDESLEWDIVEDEKFKDMNFKNFYWNFEGRLSKFSKKLELHIAEALAFNNIADKANVLLYTGNSSIIEKQILFVF